ncbi:MAG: LysE family translocator [Halopseudomonas aestusnigri]
MNSLNDLLPYLPAISVSYIAYLVATISPGPANLAIMATSMSEGRKPGVLLAAGVVMGSLTWGILAAIGLSSFLFSYAWLMIAMRIVGGLYLLWLAYKSFRSCLRSEEPKALDTGKNRTGLQYFMLGLGIHLTNPKSIFAWLSIIALGVSPQAPVEISFVIVGGCWLMGIVVFGGYALAFSTQKMITLYGSFRRWIEGTASVIFGFAGFKLLTMR